MFNPIELEDASAADEFWKHCDNRRNCSKRAKPSFCHNVFNSIQLSLIGGVFYMYFCPDVFSHLLIYCRWERANKSRNGPRDMKNNLHYYKGWDNWRGLALTIFKILMTIWKDAMLTYLQQTTNVNTNRSEWASSSISIVYHG